MRFLVATLLKKTFFFRMLILQIVRILITLLAYVILCVILPDIAFTTDITKNVS